MTAQCVTENLCVVGENRVYPPSQALGRELRISTYTGAALIDPLRNVYTWVPEYGWCKRGKLQKQDNLFQLLFGNWKITEDVLVDPETQSVFRWSEYGWFPRAEANDSTKVITLLLEN